MTHDLIKHGSRYFECTVCQQVWKVKPRNACPGLKVYIEGDYGLMFSRVDLDKLGYRTTEEALPAPRGCVYSYGGGRYVPLYDPTQAIPRLKRGRTAEYSTQVWWPLSLLPLLKTLYLYQTSQERSQSGLTPQHRQLRIEVANIVASTLVFTRAELEQMAGYALEFIIPPTPIHPTYSLQGRQFHDETPLILNLLVAYRRHMQNITYL